MDDWHAAQKSIAPPLPAYEENGRFYHGSYKGSYVMPCDEIESNRLDHLHFIIRMARRKARIPPPHDMPPKYAYPELHAVRFSGLFWADEPQPRILDLGCGTGVWAMEMAEHYDRPVIVGIDIVNIFPDRSVQNFRPNCYFQKGATSFEIPWDMEADHWSFIRLGSLCGSVTDWPELYRKIHYHLKPAYGVIEQVEIDLRPRCDDGSLPDDDNHPLNKWYQLLTTATAQTGRPIEYNPETPRLLEAAGFVDVCDYTVQLPLRADEVWPPTKDGRTIGRLYYSCLVGDRKKPESRDSGLEAMSLAAFTRELGWTYELWAEFQEQVIAAISWPNLKVYHELHIITARKPSVYERSSLSP